MSLYITRSRLICSASNILSNVAVVTVVRPRAISMPSYCLQDCHYFYRTALRLLSIPTFLACRYYT